MGDFKCVFAKFSWAWMFFFVKKRLPSCHPTPKPRHMKNMGDWCHISPLSSLPDQFSSRNVAVTPYFLHLMMTVFSVFHDIVTQVKKPLLIFHLFPHDVKYYVIASYIITSRCLGKSVTNRGNITQLWLAASSSERSMLGKWLLQVRRIIACLN